MRTSALSLLAPVPPHPISCDTPAKACNGFDGCVIVVFLVVSQLFASTTFIAYVFAAKLLKTNWLPLATPSKNTL